MKRTYKIQTFNEPKTGEKRIGLFKRATWKGEGYGMGWYGAEYYVLAKIIAFVPKGENQIVREKKSYRKVSIFSIMAEKCIKAISDEDAIQKFQQYLNEDCYCPKGDSRKTQKRDKEDTGNFGSGTDL